MLVGVAMSGGVDSTLAVKLLLEQGFQVEGFTLSLGCGPEEALLAAPEAAAQLGVRHRVVDVSGPFREKVLIPTVSARNRGETPNPCALCNAGVKFPLLWEAARRAGCQALATGHYAGLVDGPRGRLLKESVDQGKSQAYFLARVPREFLEGLLLPLGGMSKLQVRQQARARGLKAAKRPDSQDACFLPPGGWDTLVNSLSRPRPGLVVDQRGNRLAEHGGLHRFTVGQRKGLGITGPAPSYVLAMCGRTAAVTVGPAEELWARTVWAGRPLWHRPLAQGERLMARLRSTQTPASCQVWQQDGLIKAVFEEPQRAVTPGQLAVFYQDGLVVGSGFIENTEKTITPTNNKQISAAGNKGA